MDQLFQRTFNLPKIELHAHLTGCMRPQTFLELVEKKGIDIEKIDFYQITVDMGFQILNVAGALITDCQTLKRVAKEMIADYANQNTRYLEIRSTPKARGDIQSKEQYIITILEAIQELEASLSTIKVAYLISVNRNSPVGELTEAIELLEIFRQRAST